MILVDTSVWVDHFRRRSRHLSALLGDGLVVCHPFIIGELACGQLANRDELLTLMQSLPSASTIARKEILFFIDRNYLAGKGVGFVDLHLLASARLDELELWTADRRLNKIAAELQLAHAW